MILARIITGEVVSGDIVHETTTTVWIACPDGRLLWAYRDAILSGEASGVRVRVA